jgi:hypothetical protein
VGRRWQRRKHRRTPHPILRSSWSRSQRGRIGSGSIMHTVVSFILRKSQSLGKNSYLRVLSPWVLIIETLISVSKITRVTTTFEIGRVVTTYRRKKLDIFLKIHLTSKLIVL